MIPVARRLLLRNRGGLIVTVSGIAATVALVLFLFAVHDGAKDGSTRYVRTADVDIWVSQKKADNILKSSSFLRASSADEIAEIDGVAVASPLVDDLRAGVRSQDKTRRAEDDRRWDDGPETARDRARSRVRRNVRPGRR